MSTVEDLVTDIASIVTSVRPREIMTLKRIGEDYRAIYGNPIPFYNYGFSSLSDLLESFPNQFKFSMADGMLVIRTNVKNNITALIAKERKSKKPKAFGTSNGHTPVTTLFRKHKRREMIMEPELPSVIVAAMKQIVDASKGGVHRSQLLGVFREHTGYDCKYRDYGFADEEDLMRYLNERAFSVRGLFAYPMMNQNVSLLDLLATILTSRTGYTLTSLQDHLSSNTTAKVPALMKALGHVNFVDVIYDATVKGVLAYDHDLVYSPSERRSVRGLTYPTGVSQIRIVKATSPSQFTFEIIGNDTLFPRSRLHDEMQRLAPNEPLLSMFKENRHCSIEYDGEWYRAKIADLCCDKGQQSVTINFEDFPLELDRGIEVSLPTDRLRFVPTQCESVPAYVHSGSVAYICPEGGRQWSQLCCDTFVSLVTSKVCTYKAYLVNQGKDTVSVDIVAYTADGDKWSLFQRLVAMGLAQSSLRYM